MSRQQFDAIVVGSGTSAHFVVQRLAESGQKIAIIDERELGGTCALRGCQPKKYLVAHAEALAGARHLVGKGLVDGPTSDWAALQALKNKFTGGVSDGAEADFLKAGATIFKGRAQMISESEVKVDGKILTAPIIVLGTGSSPRRTDIPGAEHVHDSEAFLNLESLPSRIVFLGGGYISFEFAHVAAQAGADVTILQRSERVLKAFDSDLVDELVKASEAEAIKVITQESPTSVESTDDGFIVHGKSGKAYTADLVIEATGRVPNLSVLDGGLGGVESGPRGIAVTQYLQSASNPRVYAVGDVAATGYQLAPVADREGITAAENILGGNQHTVDYSVIPSSVFTIPSLATVGLTEAKAKEMNLRFRLNQGTTTGWPSSKRIGEEHSAYKLLIDRESDLILGAHLLRHNAGEVINIFALAMRHGITATNLREFPWAYPTYSSDLKYMVK